MSPLRRIALKARLAAVTDLASVRYLLLHDDSFNALLGVLSIEHVSLLNAHTFQEFTLYLDRNISLIHTLADKIGTLYQTQGS